MKILIIGNIGSGKTTLGKKIQEITDYKFVQIDKLREKFLKNSISGEYLSLQRFLKSIEITKNLIIEFTGVGCHKYAVKRALELSKDEVLIIRCKTRDFSKINERVNQKKFSYNNIFDIDKENHIIFIEKELKNDISNKFWTLTNSKFKVFFMDNSEDKNRNILTLSKYLKPHVNDLKPVLEKSMNVEEWRSGINICIDNIVRLYRDGEILIKDGSYGHAAFLLLTAFEETGVAYFIMDRFDNPAPKELDKKKFLKHLNKISLARFKSFLISGDINSFKDFLKIMREDIHNEFVRNFDHNLKNLEMKIQKRNNFWNFRNKCIYTSLDQKTYKYLSPLDINQNNAINLYINLRLIITNLQLHRDVVFKFGHEFIKYTKDDLTIFESIGNLFEIINFINEGKKEKLKSILKPNHALLVLIDEIEEKRGRNLRLQKINDTFYLLLKDFSLKYVQIEKKENKEVIEFVMNRLRYYFPEMANASAISIDIIHKIAENAFNIQDFPNLLNFFQDNKKK